MSTSSFLLLNSFLQGASSWALYRTRGMEKKLTLLPQYQKYLIGTGGKNIKDIRAKCQEKFPQTPVNFDVIQGSGEVMIRSSSQSATEYGETVVDELLCSVIGESWKQVQVSEFSLPNEDHKYIIGTKGQTIKDIQAKCGGRPQLQVEFPPNKNFVVVQATPSQYTQFTREVNDILSRIKSGSQRPVNNNNNNNSNQSPGLRVNQQPGLPPSNNQIAKNNNVVLYDDYAPPTQSNIHSVPLNTRPNNSRKNNNNNNDVVTQQIDISRDHYGIIIGPKGANINLIREKTNVDIQIPRENEGSMVSITGTPLQIKAAIKMIDNFITEKLLTQQKLSDLQADQTETYYSKYRKSMNLHANYRNRYFADASKAYQAGDGAKAKVLAEKGKQEQILMEKSRAKAATAIFKAKNKNLLSQNTIDLHGLQVAEAKSILTVLLHRFKKKKVAEITIITGKGIHSADGVARIKPEVEVFLRDSGYQFTYDDGAFIVNLR